MNYTTPVKKGPDADEIETLVILCFLITLCVMAAIVTIARLAYLFAVPIRLPELQAEDFEMI